jgi:predicted nucleotidyltransferase component of viral defense system
MLTRTQIQRFAQRHGISIQAQERDYLQYLLLFSLYSSSQSLVFKGGTALRIVYKGSRYSEDLDFNGPSDVSMLKRLWQNVIEDLGRFGVNAEIRNERQSTVGYSFDVSYQGPVYDGRDRTKGKVRVDISTRREKTDTRRALVSSEYDDVRPFVLTVISPDHLMAEKVRALLVRNKARDVFDIWLLINQGVLVDRKLIEKKLALYEIPFTTQNLNDALDRAKADWTRDLRPLLPQLVSWKDAASQIEPILRKLIA